MRRLLLLLALLAPLRARAQAFDGDCPPHLDALATLTDEIRNVGADGPGPHEAPAAVKAVLGENAKWLGNGYFSMAWGNDRWVVKIPMAKTRDGKPVSDTERQADVDQAIWSAEVFATAPPFAGYAALIPAMFSPGPFVLVSRRADGSPQDTLSPEASKHAEAEMTGLRHAATAVLPLAAVDVHSGNVAFAADGRLTSWFDHVVGWWIPQTAKAAVDARVAQGFHATSDFFPIGPTYAKRATGGDLQFGDALIVGNVRAGRAFVVKHGFRATYERTDSPLAPGRPLWSRLGVPLDDEHDEAGTTIQHFEHGYLTWRARETTVTLTSGAPEVWVEPKERATLASFYGVVSARMAKAGGLTGGRAILEPGPHEAWAASASPKDVAAELVAKTNAQVDRLGNDREALARLYADVAIAVLPYGAPIGDYRTSTDWNTHYAWAKGAPLDQVRFELTDRLKIVSKFLDPRAAPAN